jgi:hypothetical protein
MGVYLRLHNFDLLAGSKIIVTSITFVGSLGHNIDSYTICNTSGYRLIKNDKYMDSCTVSPVYHAIFKLSPTFAFVKIATGDYNVDGMAFSVLLSAAHL